MYLRAELAELKVVVKWQQRERTDMVNSYRRSDGPEGALTCQKIFSHPSIYSGVTVSQPIWHFRWNTGLFLSSSVNKSVRASFMCGSGKSWVRTSSVGRKSCPYGGQEGHAALVRNITLEPVPEFAWSLVSTAALLAVISPCYADLALDVSLRGCDRERCGVTKCVFLHFQSYLFNHATHINL